jgi:hypothetical protein
MPLIESLRNYISCAIWLQGFKSKSTMESYSIHLLLFCRFCALTPDELIKIGPGELKTMVFNYIIDLKKRLNKMPVNQDPVVFQLIVLSTILRVYNLFLTFTRLFYHGRK